MKDRRLVVAGLAAGAIGGFVGARLASRPRWMPRLDVSRGVLAETLGEVRATLLAARVQARHEELYARRPHFRQPALRRQLDSSILQPS